MQITMSADLHPPTPNVLRKSIGYSKKGGLGGPHVGLAA
jgi:hypothetical protein